ncbi:TPA: hypothetical protein ACF9K4_002769 [Staphylococcus aureus]|uniref:hypothetical protein n=1 Tax=Staphylococcus TaxID=1279 RepID=UPI00044D0B11|nr:MULTISPECIES: hypothetical protein [Staphylococcus]MDV0205716.1 hypothetical protein [Staphylococcus aureus]EUR16368.1 hypothetical protein T686_02739 [Staphylococcus aureus SJUD6056]MDK7754065.1 hypothetical protein [Staphylococcus sp. UMB10092B]HDB0487060.1 hypothetical protein [Staphylococcus aureus]HEJ6807494.1 hypothetical protein [Staphylococcus aureus]
MIQDLIITGTIKRVIKDKYKSNGYVVLMEEIECEGNNIGNQWIKLESMRLSKIFYQSIDKEVSLQVEVKQDKESSYNLYRIIDVIDDEYFQSDASYLNELLDVYRVNRANINDIYFNYTEEAYYTMAIITKVRDDEVKLLFNGGTDWWYLSELNYCENIYRINDSAVIKELMKFAKEPDNTLLEVYLNNLK